MVTDKIRSRYHIVPALLALAATAAAQPQASADLSPTGAQLHLEQGTYPHSPSGADHYGWALAAGDFDHDGDDDLAVGIPGNDCSYDLWDCGSVQVRFSAGNGALDDFLVLDPNGVGLNGESPPEPANALDEYGFALGIGDFQADGYEDLVVGLPGNSAQIGGSPMAPYGAVHIHYGLPAELGRIQRVAERAIWKGDAQDPVPGTAQWGERFGAALAVGDFNGDGYDDLAIGSPYDDWQCTTQSCSNTTTGRGSVLVTHGNHGGLTPADAFEMRQGLQGLPDAHETGDHFGSALAAGDFNGDGYDDLAIGVPGEDGVGAVLVVYGSTYSLLFAHHWYFGQNDLGDLGEPGDRFGEALAVGDFDGDGYDDLAVGAFRESGGAGFANIGEVSVVYGGPGGLASQRAEALFEHYFHGDASIQAFDNFGGALTSGDFTGDGIEDLAIGIEGDNENSWYNTGGVSVVAGRSGQGLLGGVARKLFPIGIEGSIPYDPAGLIPDRATADPFWGFALACGDFTGDGVSDLAIGAPNRVSGEGPTASPAAGGVAVVYFGSGLFMDGFESGDTTEWSATTP